MQNVIVSIRNSISHMTIATMVSPSEDLPVLVLSCCSLLIDIRKTEFLTGRLGPEVVRMSTTTAVFELSAGVPLAAKMPASQVRMARTSVRWQRTDV